ncbi:hypothetical protein Dimus_028694 [Dionaea muscipula]
MDCMYGLAGCVHEAARAGTYALDSCLSPGRFTITCMELPSLVVIACMVMAAWKPGHARSGRVRLLPTLSCWPCQLGGRTKLLPAQACWPRPTVARAGLVAARGYCPRRSLVEMAAWAFGCPYGG